MKTLILSACIIQFVCFFPKNDVSAPKAADPFIHSVYFWLNKEATPSDHLKFEETLNMLKKIRGVKKLYVLKPANTPRDVVDNSYDFALIIHFKNREAQNAYQVDPIHQQAVDIMRPLIDRFVVYDAQ